MFLETLNHAITLDLPWFAQLVLLNLGWVFIFAAAGYFFYGKKPLIGGLFMVLYFYASMDVVSALGWNWASGLIALPVLLFLGNFLIETFIAKSDWYPTNAGWINSSLFYGAIIFINVFA